MEKDNLKQEEQCAIRDVSGCAFWNDDKVIDFVNWYIELHKLDFRYTLENRTIIESFKNGDDASKRHCH
jgi:hypothetical protein